MIILHGSSLINRISDPTIRALVNQRFSQILSDESYVYDQHGYIIVMETDDCIALLETEIGFPILQNTFDGSRHGKPDFTPCFEALEEHSNCFEMLFILNDEGFAINIFIPKHSGIDSQLLALCTEYAIPAAV